LSIIRPPPVSFGPGNAMPSSSSASTLDTVARVMVEHPDLVVEVQGHTDAIEANAQPLSERRALSVMQALIDRGVPAERLCARGYAQARPLVPNRTVDERAKNRRVEFRVMQGDEACLP
jgi:outer membrane protein OmpA-like peptidoglycan-associated protein